MSFDISRADLMNRIASAMMDGGLPLMRLHPPDVSFEAVMGILFFIGEKAGYSAEQVSQLVKSAADQMNEVTEDDA